MVKLVREYTDALSNSNVFAYIGLFIFITFFILLLVMVKKMSKERVDELSNLPLDNDDSKNVNF
ncbi:MAG: hypothetical protein KGM98_14705 [Bacteroidota bacterium]|nr:hypothetical protein [Bacteroidota bacterium]